MPISASLFTRSSRLASMKTKHGVSLCGHSERVQIEDVEFVQAFPVLYSKAGRVMIEWHGFHHCSIDRSQ
jgi:hypothetical protein